MGDSAGVDSSHACFGVFLHPMGILLPYLGFSAYRLRRTPVSRFRSETEAKIAKRALRIWGTMENTLCETGVDPGIQSRLSESLCQIHGAVIGIRQEPTAVTVASRWKDPAASRRLIRQLLLIVNTRREYRLLRRDLAELDRLFPSHSSSVKGGAANRAVESKWLR
jgi:hypothetical protein